MDCLDLDMDYLIYYFMDLSGLEYEIDSRMDYLMSDSLAIDYLIWEDFSKDYFK